MEKGVDRVSRFRMSVVEMILFGALFVLLVYVVVLQTQIRDLKEELDAVRGDFTAVGEGLSEDITVLKTNVVSCSTDEMCNAVFLNKGYSCPQSLRPACEDKLCVCE